MALCLFFHVPGGSGAYVPPEGTRGAIKEHEINTITHTSRMPLTGGVPEPRLWLAEPFSPYMEPTVPTAARAEPGPVPEGECL